jgi:hypothetical protein
MSLPAVQPQQQPPFSVIGRKELFFSDTCVCCLLSTPKTLYVYRYRSVVRLHGRNFKAIDALVNLTRNNCRTKIEKFGISKTFAETLLCLSRFGEMTLTLV